MWKFKNNNKIIYAGFKKRFLACILDSIFVSIISGYRSYCIAMGFINPEKNKEVNYENNY
jgi:hypothetical protein